MLLFLKFVTLHSFYFTTTPKKKNVQFSVNSNITLLRYTSQLFNYFVSCLFINYCNARCAENNQK
jgi:hypothetical protein